MERPKFSIRKKEDDILGWPKWIVSDSDSSSRILWMVSILFCSKKTPQPQITFLEQYLVFLKIQRYMLSCSLVSRVTWGLVIPFVTELKVFDQNLWHPPGQGLKQPLTRNEPSWFLGWLQAPKETIASCPNYSSWLNAQTGILLQAFQNIL